MKSKIPIYSTSILQAKQPITKATNDKMFIGNWTDEDTIKMCKLKAKK